MADTFLLLADTFAVLAKTNDMLRNLKSLDLSGNRLSTRSTPPQAQQSWKYAWTRFIAASSHLQMLQIDHTGDYCSSSNFKTKLVRPDSVPCHATTM